jgi:predicted amidohydrolase YtcJ
MLSVTDLGIIRSVEAAGEQGGPIGGEHQRVAVELGDAQLALSLPVGEETQGHAVLDRAARLVDPIGPGIGAYNLFPQRAGNELEDFTSWTKQVKFGQGDDTYRNNGGGEMLVSTALDFEDFRVERPDMPPDMEGELEAVVRLLAENRWPWRLHATCNETITRALNVFEKVNRDIPFDGLHWFIDHAETIDDRNIDRIAALGGAIAVQHRMAYQGEYFVERYGARSAERSPPIRRMLAAGLPVGAGTDATRVASYNPWVSLAWLVTGRTVAGLSLYPAANLLDRESALRLWTEANT